MSARLRVYFFNRSYWPDTGATGQLLTELAEDLVAKHACDVTVVTGHSTASGLPPRPRAEVRHGVRILRARGSRFSPRRFAGRAANYLTYFASAAWTAWRQPRADVVVAMTDPPIIGLVGRYACHGAPFVFLCQDVFPEVAALLEDFRSPTTDRVLGWVTRHIATNADRVIALGDTMASRLEAKGASRTRVSVVHNWADVRAITPGDKDNDFSRGHDLHAGVVVLHAGNLGMGQGLETLVAAARATMHRPDITWLFIGDGTRRQWLEEEVRAARLTNVRLLPFQPREMMRWTYATADLCLVSLKAGLAGYIVPSKVYPALAAGRPVVAVVDEESEVAHLVRSHACGEVVSPGDPASLARTVMALADDPNRRARFGHAARELSGRFDRQGQVAAYAALLRAAANQ